MATGTASPVGSAQARRDQQRDQFIQQQLNRARRQLRMVELGTSAMALVAGILGYLLILSVVDHWIWPLGHGGRWMALALLTLAAAAYAWRYVLPPLLHSINPLYAARAIEQSEHSLKNSLVNFLFLRERPEAVSCVVLENLETTAATDLKRISVDASIDRTQLIRILYVLTAAVALFAFYKMFSPKDPLHSAYRVLMPWADVAAASRVAILEIEPGDVSAVLDERLRIVARVRGMRSDEQVTVLCTSSDQQQVERPVDMVAGADGVTYEAEIPPGGSGLRQSWTYRIRAGDALSREYRITLIAKPRITVQRLEYDFPEYTQRPRQVLEGQSDIEALEGTRVTLRAKANQPIQSAYVEWDPDGSAGAGDPRNGVAHKLAPLDMLSQGTEATAQFVLRLGIDEKTAPYSSYRLRFVTEDGKQNVDPLVHRITVFPDLAPVVDILSPKQRRLEVPLNGRLPVEVRALDPDFGLTTVKLVGSSGAGKTFSRDLLEPTPAWRGQFTAKHDISPRELGLEVGDELVFRAVARDNRHDPQGSPAPNEQRSADYRLVVTAPQEAPPSAKEPDRRTTPDQESAADPQTDESSSEETESQGDEKQGEETAAEQSGGGTGAGAQSPPGGEGSEDSEDGEGQQGGGTGAGEQSSGSASDQGTGTDGDAASESGTDQGASESGAGQGGDSRGTGQRGEGADGESAGGEPSSSGRGASPASAADSEGEGQGQPRSPDDLHDGDIFDIVRRRLEQQGDDQGSQPLPPGSQARGGQDERQPAGDPDSAASDGERHSADNGQAGTPPGDAPAEGQRGRAPGQASPEFGDQRPRDSEPAGDETGDGPQGDAEDRPQGAADRGPPGDERGGTSDGIAKPQDQGETRDPESGGEPAGDGAGENSQSGAGSRTPDPTGQGGTPPEFKNADRNKSLQPDTSREQETADPAGVSVSDHQSDSKGDQASGDQSGGGGQGAGQSAQLPGGDSAGSQQASDDGSGAAQDSGAGETSSDAGQKEQADGASGAPGTETGAGSSSRPQPMGGDPGAAGSPATPTGTEGQFPDPSGAGSRQDGHSGQATGGGIGSDEQGGGSRQPPPPLVEEKAQLDYAHRATDLVLDHLRNQQQNPDQSLLDELGWTKDDLAEFIRRWDGLKRSAASNPDARRELDDSLKSLGLRPPQDRLRRGTTATDERRGNTEDAHRTAPPTRYFEQFNAFRKGAARSTDD